MPGKKFLLSCFVNNYLLMLCTLIGAVILFINIQVGLNMHLYDDIGDASSSLRRSTSSFVGKIIHDFFFYSVCLMINKWLKGNIV